MTPHDISLDQALLQRFRDEVAYLDREAPTDRDAKADLSALQSSAGLLVVAWLWPVHFMPPGFDPFVAAGEIREGLREGLMISPDANPAGTIDRLRAHRRSIPARRFAGTLDWVASEAGCSVDELKAHLSWCTSVGRVELERLLDGRSPFRFEAIVELCGALQLEFDDGWIVIDPQGLASRVARSLLATAVIERMQVLSSDNLQTLVRRLPRGGLDDGHTMRRPSYRAPSVGARYSSLYEALASDDRDRPTYSLAAIDEVLVRAGEAQLPDSARRPDGSWWWGDGAKSEGRPQVRAWWGAGYKVRRVALDGDAPHVEFEALPGRGVWLLDPHRAVVREYQWPATGRVRIHPEIPAHVDFEGMRSKLLPVLARLEVWTKEHFSEDPDIRDLVQYLDAVGEADRSEIERNVGGDRVRADSTWMTNLLTRARRQGWIINKGSRKQPRWAATRWRATLVQEIADKCNLEVPAMEPADPIPVSFLRAVASSIDVTVTGDSCDQIARDVVESRGGEWKSSFESADGTISSLGLAALNDAIGSSWPWRDDWNQS